MASANAETLYFIAKDYPYFSHTDRLNWFFEHLSSQSPIDETEDDVLVACALSEEGEIFSCESETAKKWGLEESSHQDDGKLLKDIELRVTAQTRLHALACRYNVVFCLDMSPSMASLDPLSGIFLLDHLRKVMERCLQELVSQVKIGKFTFAPEIVVSVIALGTADQFKVLFQGMQLRSDTLSSTLSLFAKEFSQFENEIAAQRRDQSQQSSSNTQQQQSGSGSDLGAMIQMSMLALNLLPAGACNQMVLLTDGVTSLPEHTSYDSIITSLNRADVSCHIIEITGSSAPIYASLGLLPDRDVLEFLAKRSRGALIDCHKLLAEKESPKLKSSLITSAPEEIMSPRTEAVFDDTSASQSDFNNRLSISSFETQFSTLQFPLLVKQFSSTGTTLAAPNDTLGAIVDTPWIVSDGTNINSLSAIDHAYPWDGEPPPVTVMHTPVLSSYDLQLDLVQVIQLRVREGFNISDVTLIDNTYSSSSAAQQQADDSSSSSALMSRDEDENDSANVSVDEEEQGAAKLSVKVTLEWQPSVLIEYHVYEKSKTKRVGGGLQSSLRVEISVFAHYDFYAALVADAESKLKEKSISTAPASSSSAVAPLQSFLTTVAKTDRLLAHLLQHAGVICALPSSQLSTSLSSSTSSSSSSSNTTTAEMLSVLWNGITYLNITSLHKWFPEETITLLLRQDDFPSAKTLTANAENSNSSSSNATAITSVSYSEATAALLALMEKLATYSAPQNKLYLLLFTETGSLKNSLSAQPISSATNNSTSLILIRPVWQSKNVVTVHIFFLYGSLATTRRGVLQNVSSKLSSLVSDVKISSAGGSAGASTGTVVTPVPLERMPSTPVFAVKQTAHRRSHSASGTGVKSPAPPSPSPTPPPASKELATSQTTSNANNLISICAKPFLSLLVRYESADGASASASNSGGPSSTSSSSSSNTGTMNPSIPSSASGTTASSQSSTVSLALSPLATTQPRRDLLQVRYLKHQRWVYKMLSSQSCETFLQLLLLTRLEEGFTLVPLTNTLVFYKEFSLSGSSYRMLSSIQCVVFFTSASTLVVEVWIEPQQGKLPNSAGLEEVSAQIAKWLHGPNVMLSNALCSFDIISQAIGTSSSSSASSNASTTSSSAAAATPAPGTILAQLQCSSGEKIQLLQKVNLASIASQAPRVLEQYPVFSASNSAVDLSLASANQNLYVFFEQTVRTTADCEIEVSEEDVRELALQQQEATAAAASSSSSSSPSVSWKCFCKRAEDDRAVLILLSRPYLLSASHFSSTATTPAASATTTPVTSLTTTPSSSSSSIPISLTSSASGTQMAAMIKEASTSSPNSSSSQVPTLPPLSIVCSPLKVHYFDLSRSGWKTTAVRPSIELQQLFGIRLSAPPQAAPIALGFTGYRSSLRDAHQIHFGQGAYTRLRLESSVAREDFLHALPFSKETMQTEVDVTQFLSILRKYQDAPPPTDVDPLKAAQKRFVAATSQWTQLPILLPRLYNSQAGKIRDDAPDDQSYFYFKPTATDKEDLPQLSLSDGHVPPAFFSNAPYLHMELITTNAGSPASAVAVSTFPVNPQNYTKAVLRLILHSLPENKLSNSPRPSASSASMAQQQSTKYLTSFFGSLRTKVQEVVYAEILDSLRYTRPVTKQTLNTVLHHLNSLPPGSLRTLTLSLSFFDMKEGRKQFPLYLHRSSKLKLVRFGDVYLWIEPTASTTTVPPLVITPASSLKDSSAAQPDEESSVDARLGNYNIPYWLILTHQMQEDTVTALLYSYSLAQSDKVQIFKQVRSAIAEICFTINQYCLLNQLHDTRVAPELLIPKDDDDANAAAAAAANAASAATSNVSSVPSANASSTSSPVASATNAVAAAALTASAVIPATANADDDEVDQPLLVEGKGSYGCKCVDEISLPLNKRLTSQAAIRGVIGSTLHPFSVANRRNTFVYREQSGNVFYLRLSESTTSSGAVKSSALVLRVYGMTAPSQEITLQLYQLLENKLVAITLAIISNLLMRNPLLKLTDEDLEFLRPDRNAPAKKVTFHLPPFASSELQLFIAFLRTNLLLFLSQLHRENSASSSLTASSSSVSSGSSSSQESSVDEKTFLYNYIQEGPAASSLFTHIGQGIALVSTDLNASSSSSHASPSQSNQKQSMLVPDSSSYTKRWIHQLLPDDLSKPAEVDVGSEGEHGASQAILTFDIWARGSLNLDTLVEVLTARVHQTLCDLALEVSPLLQSPATYLSACKSVLKRAHSFNSPAVQHSKVSLVLSSWDMKAALIEMGTLLLEVNPKLSSSFFFTPNRKKEKNFSPITDPSQLDALKLHLQKNGCSFLVVGGKYPKELIESEFSKNEQMFYPHVKSDPLTHFRMSCVLLFVRTHKLTVLAYNLSPGAWEQVQLLITRLASWKSLRSHLLSSIVHQKCNLFHHLPNVSLTEPLPPPPASRNFALGGDQTRPAASRGETQTAVKFSLESIDLLLHSAPARTKGPTSAVALAAAAGASATNATSGPGSSSAGAPSGASGGGGASSSGGAMLLARQGRPVMPPAQLQQQRDQQVAAAAAAAQKKPPQSHAPAFADVLKSLPSVPLQWSSFGSLPDPLLRHALHFKQAATELTARNKQRAALRQLYWQIWGAGKNTAFQTAPFVKAVLAAARFIHVCSAPYALNTMKDDSIAVASGSATPAPPSAASGGKKPGDLVYFPDTSTSQAAQEWRESFAQELLASYASYLESSQGCSVLRHDSAISSKKVYLQKVFTSSMVLLELSVTDDTFVRVQLHHLLRGTRDDPNKLQSAASAAASSSANAKLSRGSSSGVLSSLVSASAANSSAPSLASAVVGASVLPNWEEVNLLRAQLHLQSFVYDLALRRFQTFLIAPPLASSAHDFVRSLHALHSYYSSRPIYARNLLFASSLSLELNRLDELSTVSPFDMFSYISTHAREYGWKNLEAHGRGLKPGLFYSPLYLPNNSSPSGSSAEVINYSIVAFFSPIPTAPSSTAAMSPLHNQTIPAATTLSPSSADYPVHTTLLNVQYYVIIVSSNPLPMTQTELITLSARKEEQETLVAEEVRKQLIQALEEGIGDYRKDHLWRKLESAGGGSGRGITSEQLRALTSLAYPREVHLIDPTLTRLFGGTPVLAPHTAQSLYTLLAKAYADRVCYQQRDGNPYRLVIMTKPSNNQNRALLLDLQLFNSGIMKLVLYARNQSDMVTQRYEAQEISTLVNRIVAWMWRDLFFRTGN